MSKKYICLRDDDTNFFTQAEDLEYCFDGAWGKIPITFAAIPYVHMSNKKMIDFKDKSAADRLTAVRKWVIDADIADTNRYRTIHPIGLNEKLVAELRNLINFSTVEIAQHGVTHIYNDYGCEMTGSEIGFYAIRDAKEYLEKIFGQKIHVFIPPGNYIDTTCVKYVNKLGMDLFCCGSIQFKSRLEKMIRGALYPKDSIKIMLRRIKRKSLPIKRTGGYTITGSVTLNMGWDYKEYKTRISRQLNRYGMVSITTHYWYMREKMGRCGLEYRQDFQRLIRELQERGDVEFILANEYIKKAKEKFI